MWNKLTRQKVGDFIESKRVSRAIMTLIIINAIILGLETSKSMMALIGPQLLFLDQLILVIFVVEVLAKIYAFGWRFFRYGWNIFDFVVVGLSLAPLASDISVIRSLRILRGLRLVAVVPAMRKVVSALISAIPGISSVVALLGLVYYVFAVMVTKLFGDSFPEWFGTIGRSLFSLFQIMTLESWSMGIVRPVMIEFPYSWLVFVPFIMLTSFAVINLFIAVIVNAMTEESQTQYESIHEEMQTISKDEGSSLEKHMNHIQSQMDEIRALLKKR